MANYKDIWTSQEKIEEVLATRGIEHPWCGFSVGLGWLPIVEEALDKMIAAGWDKKLDQVKQKFCGLRIYIAGCHPELENIIREAENKAAVACEGCGCHHGLSIPRAGVALCPECKKATGEISA